MELNASIAPGALLDPPPADPEPTEVVGPAPDAVVVVNGAGTLVSATFGSGASVDPVEAGAPSAESKSSIPIPRIAATALGEVARGAVRRASVGRGPTALSTLARAGRPAPVRARGADRASRPADADGATCPSLPDGLPTAVPLEVPPADGADPDTLVAEMCPPPTGTTEVTGWGAGGRTVGGAG